MKKKAKDRRPGQSSMLMLLMLTSWCNGQLQVGDQIATSYNYNDTTTSATGSNSSSTFVGGFEINNNDNDNDNDTTASPPPIIMNLQTLGGEAGDIQGGNNGGENGNGGEAVTEEQRLAAKSYGPVDQVRNFLNSSSNLDGITEYIDLLDLSLDFIQMQLESNATTDGTDGSWIERFDAFLLGDGDEGGLLSDEKLYTNYTEVLEGLDDDTKLEIERASLFLTDSQCRFPLSGQFDRSFDDWMFFLARRAEQYKMEQEQKDLGIIGVGEGATQTDLSLSEEMPWVNFPIYCHNDTVTVPSWLGQYAWMNDMITSLATQIGVTSIGSIPESIGNLTKLQSINLHGKVTGEIPRSIGNLEELTILLLDGNEIEGPIPPELGLASKLTVVDLSNNQLTGSVPDSIANLTSLKEFAVRDNQLTGTLSPPLLAMREDMGSSFQLQGNPLWSQYVLVPSTQSLAGWEIAIIVVAVGLATALFVLSVAWSVRRSRRAAAKQSKSSIIQMEDLFNESENLAMFCINRKDLKLMKLVGRGTYGSVFEAKWKDTPVAVKIMNVVDPQMHSREESRRYIETFEKEVEYLSQVNHRNIVKLFGYSLASPHVYIVQELMQMNLSQLTHAKDYTPDDIQILKIIEEIANGLSYLHPRIVHCDLKPQNILLSSGGEAKIADFGISKRKQGTFIQFTTTTHVPGSVIYMAPECFNAPQEISEKCDVFSLAMIMWECYTGVEPWEELPTPLSVVNAVAVQNRRPCIPVKIPPQMSRLIKKCWCTDYNKRPSCAEIAKLCHLMREDLLMEKASSPSFPPSSDDLRESKTV
jgi:tRNA A-37 threonylcarbamoyl transferase component Bud32